jgi:hypothetical protein
MTQCLIDAACAMSAPARDAMRNKISALNTAVQGRLALELKQSQQTEALVATRQAELAATQSKINELDTVLADPIWLVANCPELTALKTLLELERASAVALSTATSLAITALNTQRVFTTGVLSQSNNLGTGLINFLTALEAC